MRLETKTKKNFQVDHNLEPKTGKSHLFFDRLQIFKRVKQSADEKDSISRKLQLRSNSWRHRFGGLIVLN